MPDPKEVGAWEREPARPEQEDPYADVPPPSPDDGPQEPVDDSELEDEIHPDAS